MSDASKSKFTAAVDEKAGAVDSSKYQKQKDEGSEAAVPSSSREIQEESHDDGDVDVKSSTRKEDPSSPPPSKKAKSEAGSVKSPAGSSRTTALQAKWDGFFDRLMGFRQKHGHCRGTSAFKNTEFEYMPPLGVVQWSLQKRTIIQLP